MTASSPIVLLFRSPTSPPTSDPYHVLLTRHGYAAEPIPVLTETFRVDELGAIIEDGPGKWEGVVMMSRRGAEGWVRAAQGVSARSMFGKCARGQGVGETTESKLEIEVEASDEMDGDGEEHHGG